MKTLMTIFVTLLAFNFTAAQTVEFNVNMSVQFKRGLFNPATDQVYVRGSFNDWSTNNQMEDPNNDSVYTVSISDLTVGETHFFKFFYLRNGEEVWENDPNREVVVATGTVTYTDYFNRDSVFLPQVPVSVTFACNMELERLSGRFNPVADTVSVNGSFNGWSAQTDLLYPDPDDPNIYEGVVVINVAEGESIEFKYWYTPGNWESVENRVYTFTQEDINTGFAYFEASFNDGSLETVLNQPATIKFTVYTPGAKSVVSGNPFNVINTVHVAGSASPLQWPDGGWGDDQLTKMIQLYDDGTNGDLVSGDGIFSKDITFPAYTILDVQYKYSINFGDANNNEGGNDNEAGFATNHTLKMQQLMTSATVVDTFGVMKVSDLSDITGIEKLPGIAQSFDLAQNYPNPFNPSTSIRFSIPEEGFVTLKVFNIIGQEVATLVNEVKTTGNYEVSFDASQLTSGIYFYTINTGNYSQTKKMMLIK